MPRTVRQILRSNDGASIIMALFLFLVCAALSAVILAAGTASAGRVSGLAAADQKYYSATSAAELLSEMMSDSDVSTQVVVKRTTTTTRVNGRTAGEPETKEVCIVDGTSFGNLPDTLPLAQDVAYQLLSAWGSDEDDPWDWAIDASIEPTVLVTRTLSIAHAPAEGLSQAAQKLLSDQDVSIKAAIQSNGDLVMTLESTATTQGAGNTRNTADQPYVLQLTCKANPVTTTSTSTSHNASTGTVTRTDTKTTTITWQPAGIKTLSSSLEEEGA